VSPVARPSDKNRRDTGELVMPQGGQPPHGANSNDRPCHPCPSLLQLWMTKPNERAMMRPRSAHPLRSRSVSQSFRLSLHQAPCRITGAHQLDGPPNLTCQDSTRQHAVDGCPLSNNPLLAAWGRGVRAPVRHASPDGISRARSTSDRGLCVSWPDHPVDHPGDPTGPVWIRLDRRPVQREQARSDWSRPDRRRAPGYGSGGRGFESLAAPHHSVPPVSWRGQSAYGCA
jgi:hypothetical protein